ncbi:Rrf2 family transcriptional regulator [Paracoccus caeni]|uniref:Rrf2 family transcriptional regulator n=1 Tax=Paracoccus caeni TaxID=657651 RepID=A0A934VZW8_9RHOB|nr:Rrf2 family transcriptional regulator [Paracoccus caeni]MBK4217457.1 Rrf2 family transcriptional regulator [Paracoccus caeni]
MRFDTRLSRLLHVLLHMEGRDQPLTSEDIAVMLGSNAVVVRRIMAGLREAGYVSAERGHGGGWKLARPLDQMTLLDVYKSLGEPELFAFGLSDPSPRCLVERSVNATMSAAIAEATETLLARFAQTRLSEIAEDFKELYAQHETEVPHQWKP